MENVSILIVDDIAMNRDVVRRIFDGEFEIFQAENGVEAMKIIESRPVQIVITDIFMEPMNGYELIKNIREKEQYKKIPVIAITESDKASRKKALKAGADDLIYKPFISDILHNRIKGLLLDGYDLNRYKIAYENNPVPFVLYHVIDRPDTPSYKIMYINRAAREKYSPPYIEDTLHTDEEPEVRDFLLLATRTGETQRNTIYENNLKKWMDWTVYPDGTGLVAAMIYDITDQIQEQTELSEKSASEAIKAKNSISEIIDNIPGGIFVFDVSPGDIIVIEANASGCRLLDVDPVRIVGVHQDIIMSFVHPDDIAAVTGAMNELRVPDTEVSYKCRIRNRSRNEYVFFSAQAHSKVQSDGRIFAFISYVDISLETKLEETRTELLAEKKANQAKTDFLSRVSHDMRTPLNGILGLTEILKGKINDYGALDDLKQLEMSGKYLLNLINDTLDVSQIESGKLVLHPVVCDGRSIFNNVLALIQQSIQAKNIKFHVTADNLPFNTLYIDTARVEQIAMNLLSNAIKFTPEGGSIELTVENMDVTENMIIDRVTIKDSGIGMSKDFLPHLFEPFTQADNRTTSRSDGTGLGMTIVKKVLDIIGGTIEVESEVGKGTTISFTLPMHIATKEQIEERNKIDEVIYSGNNLDAKRVLLCEDHPLNTTIAIKLLVKKGMIVEHAENGKEGLLMFEKSELNYYDIILMDIRMPVMDGIETTRAIRQLDRSDAKTIPIIAMTANALEEDVRNTREAGMNAHIGKPIDINKLYTTMEEMLKLKVYFKKKKILIVDDLEVNREILVEALQNDYTLLEAKNGKEAIEIMNIENGIDAIITDIQMPEMDGIELIKNIRNNPRYKNISILANTQYGDSSQENELIRIGANDFIYKPSTPEIVILRVRNVLK